MSACPTCKVSKPSRALVGMDGSLRRYSQVFQSSLVGGKARALYAARRHTLLDGLSSLCVFPGVERLPGTEETWTYGFDRHVQEPSFRFLTGINQAGAILVLDPLAQASEREVLFLPAKNPEREFWDGMKLGLNPGDEASLLEMQALTGIQAILPVTQFWSWLSVRLPRLRRDHVFAFWSEYFDSSTKKIRRVTTDQAWAFRTKLAGWLRRHAPQTELRCVAALHMHHRVRLEPVRIRMARTANDWTEAAFRKVLSELPTMENEREVVARLEGLMRAKSDDGIAFPTIVACGANACTLHYQKCDESLQAGKLLLLDFGVRCGSVCSDVSRTVPVGGRYNPLQRLLYQIVLDTQRFHQAQVKPGRTIRELNLAAWEHLEGLLRDRFLAKGGQMRRSYPRPLPAKEIDPVHPQSKGPHGISHLIGEQVHEGDPFRCYQDQPLRPGMMLSNEPGLYGTFSAEFNGVRIEETLGIRIEDDLVVTARGCTNLSQAIPKDPDEIEAILGAGFPPRDHTHQRKRS